MCEAKAKTCERYNLSIRAKELRKTGIAGAYKKRNRQPDTKVGGYQSSGNCTCRSGSTLEAVVFHDVDVFLDLLAIVLQERPVSLLNGEHCNTARQPAMAPLCAFVHSLSDNWGLCNYGDAVCSVRNG